MAEEENKIVYEEIKPEDHTTHVTVAELKKWKNRTLNDLNGILQGFQRQQVESQAKLNLVWNGINAVIRAFMKKKVITAVDVSGPTVNFDTEPLITNDDVREAGEELMREARSNLEAVKQASTAGHKVDPSSLQRTPLEGVQTALSQAHTNIRTEVRHGSEAEEKKPS